MVPPKDDMVPISLNRMYGDDRLTRQTASFKRSRLWTARPRKRLSKLSTVGLIPPRAGEVVAVCSGHAEAAVLWRRTFSPAFPRQAQVILYRQKSLLAEKAERLFLVPVSEVCVDESLHEGDIHR